MDNYCSGITSLNLGQIGRISRSLGHWAKRFVVYMKLSTNKLTTFSVSNKRLAYDVQ